VEAERLLLAAREVLEPVQVLPSHIAITNDLLDLIEQLRLDSRVGRDLQKKGSHRRGCRVVPRNEECNYLQIGH
jgi:hypothetical protein